MIKKLNTVVLNLGAHKQLYNIIQIVVRERINIFVAIHVPVDVQVQMINLSKVYALHYQ